MAAKLSALIRAGAAQYPACTGDYVRYEADGPHVCALGAAYVALMGELPPSADESPYSAAREIIEMCCLQARRVDLPVPMEGGRYRRTVDGAVVDLNDEAGWTREQIAAWLESEGL